jgi:hypothetical protein
MSSAARCLTFALSLAIATATGVAALSGTVSAADKWKTEKLDATAFPPEIIADPRAAAPNGLPDGLVSTIDGADITAAWYIQPTGRYNHGILGDDIEAGSLVVKGANGITYRWTLPRDEVFEDRAPRLADLDGDGAVEVVTIRSSLTKGASVTLYGINGNALVEKGTTGFIGTANRWLNIAGIASFLGTGAQEVAFVQTPHIGGTLFIYKYAKGAFFQVAAMRDFSNHVIGSREMRLAAIADVNGDGRADLAIPSSDRKTMRIVGIVGNGFIEIASAELPAPIDKAIAVYIKDNRKGFVTGLENGDVYLVYR